MKSKHTRSQNQPATFGATGKQRVAGAHISPGVQQPPRVITGQFKGRKLAVAEGSRPLTDRIKTVIFDVLGQSVKEAMILDLYAGSGAFGIEALSRGASKVYFYENSPEAVATLRSNLQHVGAGQGSYEIIAAGLPEGLRQNKVFTDQQTSPAGLIVMIDPPFTQLDKFNLARHLELISILVGEAGSSSNSKNSPITVCLRLPSEAPLSTQALPNHWQITREKVMGLSKLWFLQNV
jgi:16S rRNA (guanine966-N2)-methyltransferase